jgi:hypothetical protein
MTLKKIVRYFKKFENEYGPWFTFAVYASDKPTTAEGVSTIVPLSETVFMGRVQTNHIVATGGAKAAMEKALKHLDSIYGKDGFGYEKLDDDL